MAKIILICTEVSETRCVELSPKTAFLQQNSNGLLDVVIPKCPECQKEHIITSLGMRRYHEYLNREVSASEKTNRKQEHPPLQPCKDCKPGCIACGGAPWQANNIQRVRDLIGA